MALQYPINPDTGEPTFRDRRSYPAVVDDVEIVAAMVAAFGFALQSSAALLYRDSTRWKDIAELSRLLHPAEFDIGMTVVIPTTTAGAVSA